MEVFRLFSSGKHIKMSGQMTIIPKPELRWGRSPFGKTHIDQATNEWSRWNLLQVWLSLGKKTTTPKLLKHQRWQGTVRKESNSSDSAWRHVLKKCFGVLPFYLTHTIYGKGIFTYTWMVDFYGKLVGKYQTWILWVMVSYPTDPGSPCQMMIGVYNHRNETHKIFRFKKKPFSVSVSQDL